MARAEPYFRDDRGLQSVSGADARGAGPAQDFIVKQLKSAAKKHGPTVIKFLKKPETQRAIASKASSIFKRLRSRSRSRKKKKKGQGITSSITTQSAGGRRKKISAKTRQDIASAFAQGGRRRRRASKKRGRRKRTGKQTKFKVHARKRRRPSDVASGPTRGMVRRTAASIPKRRPLGVEGGTGYGGRLAPTGSGLTPIGGRLRQTGGKMSKDLKILSGL